LRNVTIVVLVFSTALVLLGSPSSSYAEVLPDAVGPITEGGGNPQARDWNFVALQPNMVGLEFAVTGSTNAICSPAPSPANICQLTISHRQGGSLVEIFSVRPAMSKLFLPFTVTDFIIFDTKIPLIVGDQYTLRHSFTGTINPWVLVEVYYDSDMCGEKTNLQNGMCVPDLSQICGNGTTPQNFMCLVSMAVGGLFVGINTTPVLLAGFQMAAAWLIPIVVSGIGIGIVIVRKVH